MTKALVNLKLYCGSGKRRTAFSNGYRPLFDLKGRGLTSGMISLLDRENFLPGDEGIVEVRFLDARIVEGEKFYFYEAIEPLGECTVLQLIDSKDASNWDAQLSKGPASN